MYKSKWTRETIAEALKDCTSGNDFKKRYNGAFKAMKRHGWEDLKALLPTHSSNLGNKVNNSAKWTRESLAAVIKTCTSGNEFIRRYAGAYDALRRRGWKDLLDLLPGYKHTSSRLKYTKSYIKDLISSCHSQREFRKQYPKANVRLRKNGWYYLLDGLPYYGDQKDENPVWCVYKWTFIETGAVYIGLTNNYERRIKEEYRYKDTSPVKQYIEETGCSFKIERLETGLYSNEAAKLERKYISEYRSTGVTVLNRNSGGSLGGYNFKTDDPRSDDDILNEIFSKFKSYKELTYAGRALYKIVQKRNLYERVWERLPRDKRQSKRAELLRLVESKYTKLSELRNDQNLYSQVKRYGLYSIVSAKLEHKNRNALTHDDVSLAVSKCQTLAQFMKDYPSEYGTARRNHWEDLLEPLRRRYTKSADITLERIKECIGQCASRTEFNKRFSSESNAAKKRGIYDELVNDMPKQTGKANPLADPV